MDVTELQAKVDACRTRITALEAERASVFGRMSDATPAVRQIVLDDFDRRIAEERSMIENFEWAIRRGGL